MSENHLSRRTFLIGAGKTAGWILGLAPFALTSSPTIASAFFNTGAYVKKRRMSFSASDAFTTNSIGSYSTNATYDPAGAYYYNPSSSNASYSNPGGSGDRSASVAVTWDSLWEADSPAKNAQALVNGNQTDQSNQTPKLLWGNYTGAWLQFNFGSPKVISQFRTYLSPAGFSNTVGAGLWKWQAFNGSSWIDVSSTFYWYVNSTAPHVVNATVTGSYQLYRMLCVDLTGGNPNDTNTWFYEVEFQIVTSTPAPDMTLQSAPMALSAAPVSTTIDVVWNAIDAAAMGTDCVVEISRNGGTNWTAVTMASQGAWTTDTQYTLYRGSATVTSQPSGTSLRWRIRTLNNKQQRIKSVSIQAKNY